MSNTCIALDIFKQLAGSWMGDNSFKKLLDESGSRVSFRTRGTGRNRTELFNESRRS